MAAIVRVMKARRCLEHEVLLAEVMQQVLVCVHPYASSWRGCVSVCTCCVRGGGFTT
jgi:hypothetical protein